MTPIPLCKSLRPFACIVGAHRITDIWTHPYSVPLYLFAVPRWPYTSGVLTLLSTFHFADDIGIKYSTLLHIAVVNAAAIHIHAAVGIIMSYMCAIHLPCHVTRVRKIKHGKAAVRAMFIAGTLLSWWSSYIDCVPDCVQRIASIHVLLHLRGW